MSLSTGMCTLLTAPVAFAAEAATPTAPVVLVSLTIALLSLCLLTALVFAVLYIFSLGVWRATLVLSGIAALVAVYAGALATATPETAYYVIVATGLVLIIGTVVAVSGVLTYVYLLFFGRVASTQLNDRFTLFVAWNLLRSHRSVESFGTRRVKLWHSLTCHSWRRALGLVGISLGCLLLALILMQSPSLFNQLAEDISPTFARLVAYALLPLVGLPSGLIGLCSLVVRAAERQPEVTLHIRTAVTLPTFISIVGVSIGIWALIVVLSVMQGFETDLRQKILRTNAHIVIEPHQSTGVIAEPFRLVDALRDLDEVSEVHAFARGEVMMSSPTNIAVNVIVKGIDPVQLAASEQLRGRIDPGDTRWLIEPDKMLSDRSRFPLRLDRRPDGFDVAVPTRVLPTILLGAELATNLGVEVGSEIQLISPDGDVGPTGLRPKLKRFRVAGLFRTGMYEYDQKMAYTTLANAQRFFGLGSDINRVELRLVRSAQTPAVLGAVVSLIDTTKLRAQDWRERNKSLFAALQLERLVMFVVLGFIVLVASLLIVSSLIMLIVEKAREIAILKALGASNGSIKRVFLMIGSVIGMIGSASGVTLGVVTCVAIERFGVPLPQEYYISTLPVHLDLVEVMVVGLAGLIICVLATLYPARQASALPPIEGLRNV